MASTDKDLEEELMEAGNSLFQPPDSVDELLPLLDQVESLLSRVEQSPAKSMQTALSPSMKALVSDKLLRHSDDDVKVAIASCISEITRITAPEAPYDDDQMKDIFQLIVSSFENLSDKSSRSYNKRVMILETVAKVRSCVVMLDLECDGLIVKMFQHLLKAIREYHPDHVFSSMETIMTLVLEESEDISLELLTSILASVKRNNEEVLPVALKLGDKVLENCAVKLKPYLKQAVKSLGIPLDEYSKVVASICEETTGIVEGINENASGEQLADENKLANASSDEAAKADESKLATTSSDEAAQVPKEDLAEEACPVEVEPAVDGSPKPATSNGVIETGNEETSVGPESLKKPAGDHLPNQFADADLMSKAETEYSDAGKSVKSESKQEQSTKKRGRKPNSLTSSTEPSDSSRIDSEKEAEKLPDHQKSRSKDVHSSPGEEPSVEVMPQSENEKDTAVHHSPPKVLASEAVNVSSSSPSKSVPDESRPKKGRPKKKESLVQEETPADISSPKKSLPDESYPKKGEPKKKESLVQEDSSADISSPSPIKSVPDSSRHKKGQPKKKESLVQEDSPADISSPSKNVPDESGPKKGQPKKKESMVQEDSSADISSPSPIKSVPDESRPKKGRPKKKESLVQEDSSADISSPSPIKSAPDDSHSKKGRPKKRESLVQEDSPADISSLSPRKSVPDESRPKKGRPKKKERLVQEDSPADISSPSPSKSLPDESRPKKGRPKKKESLIQEDSPADVSMKTPEAAEDSEAKPQRRSGKKPPIEIAKDDKVPTAVDMSKNEGGATNDMEGKSQKQPGKVDAGNNIGSKSSSKKEDGKRRGRGKDSLEKDIAKSSSKDDIKEIVSSPKSSTISAKDEGRSEETLKTSSKRKRSQGEDKASGTLEYDEHLIGSKVKVWWPKDRMFYEGIIVSFDPVKKKHKVSYTDGDEEILNLRKERLEFVKGGSVLDVEQATEAPNHDTSPTEMYRRKKSKINPEPSAKHDKIDISPKRDGGGASSGKAKGTSSKSGRTSKDDGKVDSKFKDNTLKSSGISEDDADGKSKDPSHKSGKSVDDAPRAASKSKDVDGDTPKTTAKSKQDTPKTVTKFKGKTPQSSSSKSNANGTGKVKSSSSKVKEADDVKGKSPDSAIASENMKGKSQDAVQAQESETKSGKKRRRGVKA